MLPQIKVYRIDYDFIISNYLDKELWKKKWNLFVYKDNVFTLNLYSIDTKNDKICFEISYNKQPLWENKLLWYDRNNTSIDILKKQINGAIFRLMELEDEDLCRDTEGYKRISELCIDEEDRLRKIAEGYLDDNNISLEDVREAYIDKYVSDNKKVGIYLNNYLYAHRFAYLTDMLLLFTKLTDDKIRYNNIVEAIHDDEYIKKVENDIKEFTEYYENGDYEEDMINELESI
jgi:hypothetical protein